VYGVCTVKKKKFHRVYGQIKKKSFHQETSPQLKTFFYLMIGSGMVKVKKNFIEKHTHNLKVFFHLMVMYGQVKNNFIERHIPTNLKPFFIHLMMTGSGTVKVKKNSIERHTHNLKLFIHLMIGSGTVKVKKNSIEKHTHNLKVFFLFTESLNEINFYLTVQPLPPTTTTNNFFT
jgi:hypothetical protein